MSKGTYFDTFVDLLSDIFFLSFDKEIFARKLLHKRKELINI